METEVTEIFNALGGATAIANGVGAPVQTVHDWLKKGVPEIPPWRRPGVLEYAKRAEKLEKLSNRAVSYLLSQDRAPRTSADAA